MSKPHLIVCERLGRWAAAFRRALGTDREVVEVRSFAQLDEQLRSRPSTPIAVDATVFSAERLLPGIVRWSRGSPVIVLASPPLLDAEFVFREAGAAHVVFSTRQVPAAAALLARCPQTAVPEAAPEMAL